jgi:hypothetical protein
LIRIADCIAPVGTGNPGDECVTLTFKGETVVVHFGDLRLLALAPGEKATVEVRPARAFDVGNGPGKAAVFAVEGGTVGLIVDCRGRPLTLPEAQTERVRQNEAWLGALGLPA